MFNQAKLHSKVYSGLPDAVAANIDADPSSLGRRIILPLSFAGSTCHMQQLLQDGLAINRHSSMVLMYSVHKNGTVLSRECSWRLWVICYREEYHLCATAR
jgi:hypothetical protein